MDELTFEIKGRIHTWGADLVGVADAAPLRQLNLRPPDLLDGFSRAVAIAVGIPQGVFARIANQPTPEYANAYQVANRRLDDIALRVAIALEETGYSGLPIPASQILDEEDWYGAISHKAVARMAGLGWQGKSLLLVTPGFGPRVRLVTVLTDAPLVPDDPIPNRCGTCTACQEACPAGAIKGAGTLDHYTSREQALYFSRCVDMLVNQFSRLPGVENTICGVCIKVCPFGNSHRR